MKKKTDESKTNGAKEKQTKRKTTAGKPNTREQPANPLPSPTTNQASISTLPATIKATNKKNTRRKKQQKNTQEAVSPSNKSLPNPRPTGIGQKSKRRPRPKKMGDKTPVESENQPNLTPKPQTPNQPLGFIENVDFIRFDDSDQEADPANQQGPSSKPNKDKSGPSRGTKRKLGAVITEEQADAVRKKKGLIITPWFDRLSWKGRNVQQMLTAEIGSFVAYIQPTQEEHQLRQMIIQMIRKTVHSRWPDADVEPFGSFGTKLYLPAGDIDLVIISTQMMNEQKSRILYKLAPLIRENNIGQDVVVIAKAKVPIIKFKTIFGNINVDISINQTNGIVAMKKVNELLDDIKCLSLDISGSTRPSRDLDQPSSSRKEQNGAAHSRRHRRTSSPDLSDDEKAIPQIIEDLGAAKCLILVIKSVLKQRGMNEVYTGGLGSYSIICLVVSFLQLHPKIQRGDIDPNKNLGVLLLEFFELYGKHFNFDQTGISVRKGGFYFSKAHRGWQRERQPYLLSIEDPADESNDIAGGSHNILSVRSVFAGAFDLLSATLYHRHSIQSSRDAAFDDRTSRPLLSVPVPKQQEQAAEDDRPEDSKDPMAESLLGEIMGVTKELVENRKKNMKLFYNGTLQRLLELPPPQPAGSINTSSKIKPTKVSRLEDDNRKNPQSTRSSQAAHLDSRLRSRSSSPAQRDRRRADDRDPRRADARDHRLRDIGDPQLRDDRDPQLRDDRDPQRGNDRNLRPRVDRDPRREDDRDPRRRAHDGPTSNRDEPKEDHPAGQSRRQLIRYDDMIDDPPSKASDDRDPRRLDDHDSRRRASQNSKRDAPREDYPDGQSRRPLDRHDDLSVYSPREERGKADKKGKRKAPTRYSPPPLWIEDVEPTSVDILKRFAGQTEGPSQPVKETAEISARDPQPRMVLPQARRPSSTPSIEIDEPVRRNGVNGKADQEDELVDSKYRAISSAPQSHIRSPTNLLNRITSPPPDPPPLPASLMFDDQSLLSRHQVRGLTYFVDEDSDSQFSEPGQIRE